MMRQDSVNRIAYVFCLALLIVVLAAPVHALGVGPSRQILSFVPGETIEGELIIINDQGEDFRAAVYAQGDLSNYVTIDTPLVEISSSDTAKAVPYKVKFPSKSPSPGPNKIDLVVRQFPKGTEADEGPLIAANLAVISQMIIKVPYPGIYAEGKLFISGTEDTSTPARFLITVYNFGTANIEQAHARIEIQGPLLGKIDEFNTETKSVKSKEELNLEAMWTPAVDKGTYKAVVTLYYDGKQVRMEQNFDLGNFVIDVSDISVDKFTLGDVAKFDILLENRWNTRVDDVYTEVIVEDADGKKMTELKTAAIDIPAKQSGELEAFWYTEGVPPGIYKVKLIVHYAGKVVQKEYDFEVDTNSFKRLGAATTGRAASRESDEEASMQGFMIILIMVVIALLLVMNMVWFYFLSKQFRKGGDK